MCAFQRPFEQETVVEEGHQEGLSDGTNQTETDDTTPVNLRTRPDVIQLKVGTTLKMFVGYEKMYETGVGEEIKSRLITVPVEIIILDASFQISASLFLMMGLFVIHSL